MKRKTGIIIFLGLVSSIGTGMLFFPAPEQNLQAKTTQDSTGLPNKVQNPLPSSQSETKYVSQEVLLATIAELRKEISSVKSQAMPAITPEAKPQPDRQESIADIEQKLKEQKDLERETFQKVGQHFTEQQVDTSWSTEAETRIETALNASKSKGLNIDYVECRSSICKLEIENMDAKAMDTFRDDFRQQTTDVFSAGMVGEDEYGKTIIYMSKTAEDIYEN